MKPKWDFIIYMIKIKKNVDENTLKTIFGGISIPYGMINNIKHIDDDALLVGHMCFVILFEVSSYQETRHCRL